MSSPNDVRPTTNTRVNAIVESPDFSVYLNIKEQIEKLNRSEKKQLFNFLNNNTTNKSKKKGNKQTKQKNIDNKEKIKKQVKKQRSQGPNRKNNNNGPPLSNETELIF